MGISQLQHDGSKSVCLSICLSVDLSIFLSVCLPSSVEHLFLHSIHIGVHLSYLNKPVIKGHFYAGFTSISQCFNKKWDFLCKDVIHTEYGLFWHMTVLLTLWIFAFFWKPSVFELARNPDFSSLPVIVEDFIKDHGGQYNSMYTLQIHLPKILLFRSPSPTESTSPYLLTPQGFDWL